AAAYSTPPEPAGSTRSALRCETRAKQSGGSPPHMADSIETATPARQIAWRLVLHLPYLILFLFVSFVSSCPSCSNPISSASICVHRRPQVVLYSLCASAVNNPPT